VALDDLFAVETAPNGTRTEANKPVLGTRDSRRLAQLLDKQGRQTLSGTESDELEALVAKYRHLLHERRLSEIARQRGISVEQARREAEVPVNESLRWWRTFSTDPQRRQGVADQVKRRRARQAE
jgi:nucleotidyltransferase/DNA polymerase involved in DNA repair